MIPPSPQKILKIRKKRNWLPTQKKNSVTWRLLENKTRYDNSVTNRLHGNRRKKNSNQTDKKQKKNSVTFFFSSTIAQQWTSSAIVRGIEGNDQNVLHLLLHLLLLGFNEFHHHLLLLLLLLLLLVRSF